MNNGTSREKDLVIRTRVASGKLDNLVNKYNYCSLVILNNVHR